MIFAAVIVCSMGGCIAVTDTQGPYATEAECRARHEVMRGPIALVARQLGPVRTRELCAPLTEIRRHIPGAFPGKA